MRRLPTLALTLFLAACGPAPSGASGSGGDAPGGAPADAGDGEPVGDPGADDDEAPRPDPDLDVDPAPVGDGEGGDGVNGDDPPGDPDPEPEPAPEDDPAPEPDPDPAPYVVPEFGVKEAGGRRLEVIANAVQGLRTPRDLEFNPKREGELWIVDRRLEGVVLVHDATSDDRTFETRIDVAGAHFMAQVSSLAFGVNRTFATCQESRNEIDPLARDFMGPSLWSSDLGIFAMVGQTMEDAMNGLNGSHLDMLHQSPLCMGIAHEEANIYWVADGAGGPQGAGGLPHIVRYDFAEDHGPGRSDHSDGKVHRYVDARFHPVPGVPSHLERDPGSDWLYYVETGWGQVMRMDTQSGRVSREIPWINEPLAEYAEMADVTVEVFVEDGLQRPSGIAITSDRIFVSDWETGEIVAYDHDANELGRIDTGAREIMGLTVGPDGRLWYVDGAYAEVVRVLPEG